MTTEVRFGRLERRGLLLGLSGTQLGLVGTALLVLVAAGTAHGPLGITIAAPLWTVPMILALTPIGGRPMVEAIPVAIPWVLRRVSGRSVALARPVRPAPLVIPGVPIRLRIVEDETGSAVLRTVRRGTGSGPFVVVARVCGRGFLLDEPADQDRRVGDWARLLGSLGQLGHISGVQVLHRTTSDPNRDLRAWWASQARVGAAWASKVLAELVEVGADSSRVETLVAVSVRPRRGVTPAGVIAGLTDAFEGAGLDLDAWLTPRQISRVIHSAYDLAGAAASDVCGPMGVAEAWSHARSDSACHATFWVSEWPRSATHPGFLRTLLLAPGATRTFSLTAQPLATGKALREIRRARAEQTADAATRARIGQVEDEAARAAAAELTRREEDLIAGHGDLRFTGLVAVSASTPAELDDACAALLSAAGQAGCELRRLVGQQVQAYAAAALPLARVLS
ncbi:MAG TPA: SCO6880 family protein [Sporichthyaceae bacterium]|jgi:hypothetical protein|nr:SCO6880 family protein [Sporichthyaceae bacterium]